MKPNPNQLHLSWLPEQLQGRQLSWELPPPARSQFQWRRKIPFVPTDHVISHSHVISWNLCAKQAPTHIAETWVGTSWFIEVLSTGTRVGKPFRTTHLFHTLRTTPEALPQPVLYRCNNEGWHWIRGTQLIDDAHDTVDVAPGHGHAEDRGDEAVILLIYQSRYAGSDARHHGNSGEGLAKNEISHFLSF